jgi:hypothetical protein
LNRGATTVRLLMGFPRDPRKFVRCNGIVSQPIRLNRADSLLEIAHNHVFMEEKDLSRFLSEFVSHCTDNGILAAGTMSRI